MIIVLTKIWLWSYPYPFAVGQASGYWTRVRAVSPPPAPSIVRQARVPQLADGWNGEPPKTAGINSIKIIKELAINSDILDMLDIQQSLV